MPSNILRAFSLYDFFSVFLPGMAALLAVAIAIPTTKFANTSIVTLATILIVSSFIVGQALHSIAVLLQRVFIYKTQDILRIRLGRQTTNRSQKVIDQLPLVSSSEAMGSKTRSLFWEKYSQIYGVERQDANVKDAYNLIRSRIAIDGRGRSQHFQAIHAFCRSMWFTLLVISLLYAFDRPKEDSILQILAESSAFLTIGNIWLVFLLGSVLFVLESRRYRRHYIDYLIMDFVNISLTEDDRKDV